MQANRGRDTEPEMRVRRLLHALGARYRVHYRPAFMPRRSIDIAFPRRRVACFVDGCFWHGCPHHFVPPKANRSYWEGKIDANQDRDRGTDALLTEHGWIVLRFWEHEAPDVVAQTIFNIVRHADSKTFVGRVPPHPADCGG